jgi:intraflagellar transport protein 46
MDSDDDGFAKQGGEALDIGDDFDSEEEVDEPAPQSAANAMP